MTLTESLYGSGAVEGRQVRFNTSGFGEEETVVGRDNDMLSILLSHAMDTESDLAR